MCNHLFISFHRQHYMGDTTNLKTYVFAVNTDMLDEVIIIYKSMCLLILSDIYFYRLPLMNIQHLEMNILIILNTRMCVVWFHVFLCVSLCGSKMCIQNAQCTLLNVQRYFSTQVPSSECITWNWYQGIMIKTCFSNE